MNQQQQRMAAVGTDKELSDLLDFSMMFPLPVANGKNRPTTLASTQFGGSGLDERPGSGSWGTADQNSSTFDQGRSYGEGPHYGEHRDLPSHNSISSSPFLGAGLVGKSSERASYSTFGRDTGMPGLNQPGFLPSEMGIASPSTLSPTGGKGGSQYFSYPNNPRRRGAESSIDGQPKKVRKVPPGLPSSDFSQTKDAGNQDPACIAGWDCSGMGKGIPVRENREAMGTSREGAVARGPQPGLCLPLCPGERRHRGLGFRTCAGGRQLSPLQVCAAL